MSLSQVNVVQIKMSYIHIITLNRQPSLVFIGERKGSIIHQVPEIEASESKYRKRKTSLDCRCSHA